MRLIKCAYGVIRVGALAILVGFVERSSHVRSGAEPRFEGSRDRAIRASKWSSDRTRRCNRCNDGACVPRRPWRAPRLSRIEILVQLVGVAHHEACAPELAVFIGFGDIVSISTASTIAISVHSATRTVAAACRRNTGSKRRRPARDIHVLADEIAVDAR
jgi:hypothetical protein